MCKYADIYDRIYESAAVGGCCPSCASALAFQLAMRAAVQEIRVADGASAQMLATLSAALSRFAASPCPAQKKARKRDGDKEARSAGASRDRPIAA